jgi:hypothetical protein
MSWHLTFAKAIGDVTIDSFACEIQSLSRYIGKTGSLDAKVPIPNPEVGKRMQGIIGGEGRLSMYAYRDGECWWGGFLDNTRVVSSDLGAVLEVKGATFESYVDRREHRQDTQITQLEQTQYARYMWDYMQGTGPGSSIGVNTNIPNLNTKKRDMSWLRADLKTVGSILKEVSNRVDGFEWAIDVYDDGAARRRDLIVGYPTIGRPDAVDAPAMTMTYPGDILTYEIEGDALEGATSFQARGKAPDPVGTPNTGSRGYYDPVTKTTKVVQGTAGTPADREPPIMSSKEFTDTGLHAVGYVRIDASIDRPTVTEVSTLDDWADLALKMRSGPLVLPGVVVRMENVTQAALGSNVALRISDHPYPAGPYGEPGWEGLARVIGYEISPGSFGSADVVKLVLENPYDKDNEKRDPN